jgi:hypothetical protein
MAIGLKSGNAANRNARPYALSHRDPVAQVVRVRLDSEKE